MNVTETNDKPVTPPESPRFLKLAVDEMTGQVVMVGLDDKPVRLTPNQSIELGTKLIQAGKTAQHFSPVITRPRHKSKKQ